MRVRLPAVGLAQSLTIRLCVPDATALGSGPGLLILLPSSGLTCDSDATPTLGLLGYWDTDIGVMSYTGRYASMGAVIMRHGRKKPGTDNTRLACAQRSRLHATRSPTRARVSHPP